MALSAPQAHTNGYEFSQGSGYALPEYASVVPESVSSGVVEHHQIIIVGGGLAGLTLACSLAQLGVRAVLLDEDNTVGVKGASSRGICYTQKSLEIFDKLGIYERVKAKGIEWSVGRTFAGDDEVYRFDLKQQSNYSQSVQPAFINIQQFYNEGYLVERIGEFNANKAPSAGADNGIEIRWNNRVTNFAVNNALATLSIATHAGAYKATADFIIDATGARSPFRQWLGVGVTAKKGDDRWCIADVRFNTQPPTERHTWIEAPFNDHRAVWQHLMGDQVWRIDYQMAPDADPEYVSREDVVKERLAKQFGPDVQVDIVWVGPYAYRSECVDKMLAPAGKSLVFFMGDSAKVVSPFGARGGNTGIADADNLAWKLAAVVQGHAAPSLVHSYHAERHEAAQTNVLVTNRTARFLRPADGAERLFRSAAIALAKKHPFARAFINTGRMAVANPYSASPLTDPRLGTSFSVQNVALTWADGSAGCLNDLLRWAGVRPLVLVWGDIVAKQRTRLLTLAGTDSVRIVHVAAQCKSVQAREAVLDPAHTLWHACHPHAAQRPGPGAWALLRPDSYLCAQGRVPNTALIQAIARCRVPAL